VLKTVEGFYGTLRGVDACFNAYLTRRDPLHITLAVIEVKSGEEPDIQLWVDRHWHLYSIGGDVFRYEKAVRAVTSKLNMPMLWWQS